MAAPSPARTHPWDLLFGPWSVGVGVVVVVGAVCGAFLAAPGALGIDLCWFRRVSGLPCPGCGLTRSIVALVQGDLPRAVGLHPFGPLVLAWASAAAASPLLRGARRSSAVDALRRHAAGVDRGYRAVVAAFLAFGVVRLAGAALGLWSGP